MSQQRSLLHAELPPFLKIILAIMGGIEAGINCEVVEKSHKDVLHLSISEKEAEADDVTLFGDVSA